MNEPEAENRGIDQELFNILNNRYKNLFCYETMGIKLMYLDKQAAGMKMIPNTRLSTSGGRIHGGIISTLTDAVMGAAGATMGGIYRTVEMKLNYMAPAFEYDELIAEARVLHPGKTFTIVEGDIINKAGRLIVKSLGTFIRDRNNTYIDLDA